MGDHATKLATITAIVVFGSEFCLMGDSYLDYELLAKS